MEALRSWDSREPSLEDRAPTRDWSRRRIARQMVSISRSLCQPGRLQDAVKLKRFALECDIASPLPEGIAETVCPAWSGLPMPVEVFGDLRGAYCSNYIMSHERCKLFWQTHHIT